MQAYIVTTIIGSFAVSEKNKIILFKLFPNDPEEIARKLRAAETETIDEEKQLMKDLWNKGYKKFVFTVRKHDAKSFEFDTAAEQFVKDNLRNLALEKKIVKDQVEFNQLLTKVNLELTKVRIKKAVERDNFVIQANGAIEEIDKEVNILIERLREFYGLHFPEMDRAVSDHGKYASIVEKYGARSKIEEMDLKQLAEKSMGADFTEDDIQTVRALATQILSLYKLRDSMSKYLERLLKDVAPNFTDIAGPLLAAKLIGKAHGLDKLARMPSSTIQLIGSEKSLFRYLHGKGKSPKYGVIFVHPLIQKSPREHQGKIARALAAKLSIASKLDYYSKEYKGDKLKKELQEKVKEILKSK